MRACLTRKGRKKNSKTRKVIFVFPRGTLITGFTAEAQRYDSRFKSHSRDPFILLNTIHYLSVPAAFPHRHLFTPRKAFFASERKQIDTCGFRLRSFTGYHNRKSIERLMDGCCCYWHCSYRLCSCR